MRPVDLTLAISGSTPVFPGSPEPMFIGWSSIGEDGYNLELVFMSSHTGTHVDAPYHFVPDGIRIDEVPVGRLVVEDAVLVRLPKGRNRPITKAEITSFERANGAIPDGSSVVFDTGWQKNLRKAGFFTENPGLSVPAARYLASKCINLVGIDSPSIDVGRDRSFGAHRALLGSGALAVENLANLGRIPAGRRFGLAVLPLKLKGATGSPARAVALL